ncbi:flagellar hook-associated protein FlgK [Limnohabitans sp. Hippo3]|uniref:flagellar hook-associated protein FlgK n=1 Tax=Limnohabitans sp. Hippo3 TaxID=1597956 RepID=UPI000D3B5627|nr:flagellar hook-associated protein FlgK [Limnohabitans sp. Hippo3]PUE43287.1 flagellar hook-associated protein FlgK [Limnohabitans sp. Hippo3]
MSDLLSIGSSGVTAYQLALATVSNNIANVNTDGYTRQDVSLTANQPRQIGNSYLGTGARFDAVQRQYDAFVESNLRNSNSDLASQKPLLSYVNRLIDVMGDESIGLTTAMNRFFESARDLSSDPASVVSRSIFLRDADGLAARFRQLAGQFEILDTETRQSVETDVGQVNALTYQLSQMNKQLAKHSSAASQPSELLDQRDLLLRELSSLVAIKTRFEPNGAVTVSVGDTLDQGILVSQTTSRSISVIPSSIEPGKLEFIIDAYGTPETMPGITSGKIGGVMSFRDQVLKPASNALDGLAATLVDSVNAVHSDGVDAEGQLGGNLFGFAPGQDGKAASMTMVIQDANRVAAAGQFRVIDDPLNSGTAQARILYSPPDYQGPNQLRGDLALAQAPQIATLTGLRIEPSQGFTSLGLIPIGTQNLSLTLQSPGPGQTLQVLTRDGRHLLGSALTPTQQGLLVKQANGMEAGATYSATTLNASHPGSYLGMDIFMGAKASVSLSQQFNAVTGEIQSPLKTAATLTSKTFVNSTDGFAAGALTLNGKDLPALDGPITLSKVVDWINDATAADPVSSRVTASIQDGKLVLSRPASNTTDDIRLGMGSGTPADLQRLGFDTTISIEGGTPDDLLVFVTDQSLSANAPASTVNITAQFSGIQGDMKQTLRASALQVEFTSDQDYKIIDSRTNTVLAERRLIPDPLSATPSLSYRGLKLSFSTAPKAGDQFTIDGNRDGIGNNETMLRLVNLETKRTMPGGLTMTEAYIERVNQVGNVARQAAIAEQALSVVYQQAQEARDGISGVSLDEEASALVRFQQAYQANAKVMQTAMALFDTILQVR